MATPDLSEHHISPEELRSVVVQEFLDQISGAKLTDLDAIDLADFIDVLNAWLHQTKE